MPSNIKEVREEFVHWLSTTHWHFFLTLNLNCESNYTITRSHFRRYCQRVDRKAVGPRYWKSNDKRTLIIALPEHLDSNLHLHCLVLFRRTQPVTRESAEQILVPTWKEVVASGSADLRQIAERYGLARYVAKELSRRGNYEKVTLSAEFWK